MRAPFLPIVVVIIASASSCVVETAIPPGARLLCGGGDVCPSGTTCFEGRCLTSEQLEVPAPAFERAPNLTTDNDGPDGEPSVDAVSPNAEHDGFAVDFKLNVDVDAAAVSAAGVGDVAIACTTAGEREWACAGSVDDATPAGFFVVTVTVVDELGRDVSGSVTLEVDAEAPTATLGTVSITGAPPRTVPSSAGVGARVTIPLRFDEETAPGSVSVVGAPPQSEVYGIDPATGDAFIDVDATLPEGPREIRVTAADAAGNVKTTTIEGAYDIDVTAPGAPAVDVADAVVYTRAPWGRALPSAAPPSSSLSGAAGSVENGAIVVVTADAAGAQTLALVDASAGDGSFSASLAIGDLAQIFVSAVDGAGNRSPVVRVRDGVWIATTARPPGSPASAIDVDVTPRLRRALFDESMSAIDASATLAGAGDGAIVGARTRAQWRERRFEGAFLPVQRAALTHDAGRDELVLFGGVDDGGLAAPLAATWTFDGEQWRQRAPDSSPPARHGAAMEYDFDADVVVLFGGSGAGGALLDDVWTWDGTDWLPLATAGAEQPAARTGARFVLHPGSTTPGLVLFGGETAGGVVDETWRLDVLTRSWTRLTLSPSPPARADYATAPDGPSAAALVWGGHGAGGVPLDDTWLFEDDAWQPLLVAAAPPAQAGASAFFDRARNRTVLVAADDNLVESLLFTLDPAVPTWEPLSLPAEPAPRRLAAAAALADRAVVVGGAGAGGALLFDTQVLPFLTDAAFVALTQETPPPLTDPSGALEAQSGRVVVAGGAGGGRATYGFDGLVWQSLVFDGGGAGALTMGGDGSEVLYVDSSASVEVLSGGAFNAVPTSPPLALGASVAAAFDGSRVVAVGTDIASLANGTWVSDATPGQRTNAAVSAAGPGEALSPTFGEGAVLLFGGEGCGAGTCDDAWLWNAGTSSWTQLSPPAPAPPARSDHAMAYDSGRGEAVLFGGTLADASADGETWAFASATSSWRLVDVDEAPPARAGHALAQAPAGRIVLFGGTVGIADASDTWEYDGGGADQAAVILRTRLSAAGVAGAALIDVVIDAVAGGDGSGIPGADILRWTRAGWRAAETNTAPASAPAALTVSALAATPAIFVGADQTLHAAFTPQLPSGAFVDADEIVVDAVEITFRYRLP